VAAGRPAVAPRLVGTERRFASLFDAFRHPFSHRMEDDQQHEVNGDQAGLHPIGNGQAAAMSDSRHTLSYKADEAARANPTPFTNRTALWQPPRVLGYLARP
jgi:hypothetical protein